jgi:hypothetical protein
MSVAVAVSGSIVQLLRIALIAFLIIHFLRRRFKVGARGPAPPQTARPARRRADEFRDEPPPPENPHLG